jgi:hypothetical protein
MEKELEILKHINELYVGDTTDEEIIRFAEKNTEKVAAWKAAFAKYDLADVLQVVDEYWNFKNNKTSPRVAQILAILNSKKEVEKDSFSVDAQASRFDESNWRYWVGIDLARALMIRGGNKNLRFWYQKAVDAILAERVDRQPEARFWDYGRKVKECFERGFFDDVDEIAENIRQREIFGKGNAMPSSVKESGNWLASHWKAGA